MKRTTCILFFLCLLGTVALRATEVGVREVFETSRETTKSYAKPFVELEVDAVFRSGGKEWRVPAFWAGGGKWTVRFAPPATGDYTLHLECSDKSNHDFDGEDKFHVAAYRGNNPLLQHGFLRVAADKRHFEHADGTPFFWLGDTWWKGLCQRLTWEGFQELAADRKAKGFSVVQIVCGVYPDENTFERHWDNEGGKPYLDAHFTEVNPTYFEYADRRIRHLVDQGIVPAIVGGWGRGDCDGMKMAGVAGIKRHWRNLIARYGAFPTVWILGGESQGPQWVEIGKYVRAIDPYRHPATIHPFHSARQALGDDSVIDFDMLQTGHGDWDAARGAIPKIKAACARAPIMPALIGEYCYEGHMQTAHQDVQRHVFWAAMLSGAAGQTYGAAGIWHMGVEGDSGIGDGRPVYDYTTWKEGMNAPGAAQLGLGKRLLQEYPWWRFEPHPEWADKDAFAAGIPGEVRFIYQPRRGVYNWSGIAVKNLEPDARYRAYYFNPTNAKRYDRGIYDPRKPPALPSPQDWVLVLERQTNEGGKTRSAAAGFKAWNFSTLSDAEARKLPGGEVHRGLPPQTSFYLPRTTQLWDNWLVFHKGIYYMYQLTMGDTPGGWQGQGTALATSPDGVHWKEVGVVLPKAPGAVGFGTGSVWKSANFDRDGRYIMNFSEWFGTYINSQFIRFAESTDLIHWKRLEKDCDFPADARWYQSWPKFRGARWDCIYTVARPGGGRYGYWTANPLSGVGFGFGETADGAHWQALSPPKIDWGNKPAPRGCEAGAVEKIGEKYYMMLGCDGMVTLVADAPQGPFHAAAKNYNLLRGHTYFARFFPTPDGLLVNHQSIPRAPRTCRFAPLKVAQVDAEGTLRLAYWKGNEKAKDEVAPIELAAVGASAEPIAMLSPALDAQRGVILEGALPLDAKEGTRHGLYVEYAPGKGTAILCHKDGVTELGTMNADGTNFKPEMRIDRQMRFGPAARFRLMLQQCLLEFYLDDILIQCYSLPANATGRIGVITK